MAEMHRPDPDRDVDAKMIWRIAIGLSIGLLVAAAVVLVAFFLEKRHLDRSDPASSPIAEARVPETPPGPLLQKDPTGEMKALRASEDRLLHTYAWVDRGAGVARVPLERAMEIVAKRGLAPLAAEPSGEDAPPARMEPGARRPVEEVSSEGRVQR